MQAIIGVPGSGKTTFLAEVSKEQNCCVTGLNNACIFAYLQKIGKNYKYYYNRTIYGIAMMSLMAENVKLPYKYLNPSLNNKIKSIIAKKFNLDYGDEHYSQFGEIIYLYSKAIHSQYTFDAVYDMLDELVLVDRGTAVNVLKYIEHLRKRGLYFDYPFLLEEAYSRDLDIFRDALVDVIYVDEAQDLTPIAYYFLEKHKDKVVLVGDPLQCIYQFMGSTNKYLLKAKLEKVLKDTKRFGRSIGELANKILEKYGITNYRIECDGQEDFIKVLQFDSNVLINIIKQLYGKVNTIGILVRTNREAKLLRSYLVQKGFASGKIAEPVKKEWQKLADLIKDVLSKNITNKTVANYCSITGEQYSITLFDKLAKLTVDDLKKMINSLVTDYDDRVTFYNLLQKTKIYIGTVHSAKGLEFDAVIYVDRIPKLALKKFDVEHELCVLYTAVTRAKKYLYILKTERSLVNSFLDA